MTNITIKVAPLPLHKHSDMVFNSNKFVVTQTEQNKDGHWSKCLGIFNTFEDAKMYGNRVYPKGHSEGSYHDSIGGSIDVLQIQNVKWKNVKFDYESENENDSETGSDSENDSETGSDSENDENSDKWIVIQTEQHEYGTWSKCLGMFHIWKDANRYANSVYPSRDIEFDHDSRSYGSIQVLQIPNIEEKSVKFEGFNECLSCGIDSTMYSNYRSDRCLCLNKQDDLST